MGLADALESSLGAKRRPSGHPMANVEAEPPTSQYFGKLEDQDNSAAARAELDKELARRDLSPAARRILEQEKQRFSAGSQPQGGGLAASLEASLKAPARDMSKWVPDSQDPQPAKPEEGFSVGKVVRNVVMAPIEGADAALSMVTGAVAAPVARAAGVVKAITSGDFGSDKNAWQAAQWASDLERSLTYQPRTEGGRNLLETVVNIADETKIAGMGPPEAMLMAGARPPVPVRPGVREVRGALNQPKPTGAMGSVGAAGTNPVEIAKASVANASPELRAEVEKVLRKGGRVSQEVIDRHVDADSLPVRMRLTEGQATGDPKLISDEMNKRGKNPSMISRLNEQNQQLIDNTNAIRESAAPDIYVQSKPELGDMHISAYRALDDKLNKDISAKYQALKDANGGDFPLDAKQFVSNAEAKLHKELLFDHVPPELKKTLERLSSGGMTFENFESLRTNLARIQRSTTADGNVKAAAGVIRDALEDLPMPAGAEHLKPLADQARAAAKARFDLINKDPAYKAVVNGKASADKFVDKYVIGSDVKNVQTMLQNIPDAAQASRAGLINHLKTQAGITDETKGKFSQSGYNKALEGLRPKLGVVFDPKEAKQLETLGRVARYTKEQPSGSYVNNSNTLVGAIAEGAKNMAEEAANKLLVFPVGTAVRNSAGRISEGKIVKKSLQTGAGIQLKDVGKGK